MLSAAVVLLAAGESTRMGRQKALLPWEGTTLLQYHLDQCAAVDAIREVVVVTGHEPSAIVEIAATSRKARIVHNAEYRTGKASSVRTGMNAVSGDVDAIALVAVDQPRSTELLEQLLREHEAGRAAITLPVRGGRRGHPIVFDAALLPELRAVDEATLGVRAVIARDPGRIREIEVADPSIHLDLNTPEALANAEADGPPCL